MQSEKLIKHEETVRNKSSIIVNIYIYVLYIYVYISALP